FELERRALMLPVAPNRHLIPHEVLQVLLEKQLRIAQMLRGKARERLRTAPIEPLRAQFAIDPTARALVGATLAIDQPAQRTGVGTARRLVKRLATRLGLAEVDAQFLACISRKAGLWVPGSNLRSGPVHQLAGALFFAWCSGGVWDEGRVA